jgi:hypothetical protein
MIDPPERNELNAIHRKASQFNAETQRRRGAESSQGFFIGIQEIGAVALQGAVRRVPR